MTVHSKLEQYEDNWQTEMGGWIPGEDVILRGKSIFSDFGDATWMEILLFANTGKRSKKTAKLLDGLWAISTSYPEPRIWNNRISALAGTARSTGVMAAAGSLAVTEATLYGLRPIIRSADFLVRAKELLENGAHMQEIISKEVANHKHIFGYGRPVVNRDERIVPAMNYARSIGCGDGEYTKLAFDIEDVLSSSKGKYSMNIAALVGALLLDEGCTPREYYDMTTLCFTGGAMPCFIDAASKPEGSFFPLRVSRVSYLGENKRCWS